MKINLTKEVQNHDSILGHIVLQCMTDALMKLWMDKRQSGDIIADVKLTVDGHELNVEKFIKLWQGQIEDIILNRAKELTINALNDKFNDVDELLFDLQGRLKEEINNRLEDWEKDVPNSVDT